MKRARLPSRIARSAEPLAATRAPGMSGRLREQWRGMIALIMLIIACAGLIGVTNAQPRSVSQRDLTTAVKAGVVYQLTKHVEWPEEVFDDTENERAPIVIGIVGSDIHGFEPYLEQLVRGERTQGRRLVVWRLEFPVPEATAEELDPQAWREFVGQLHQTHLLFIARSERTLLFQRARYRYVLDALEDRPILTVSDIPAFAEEGGMIGMTIREERWALDANLRNIRRSEVRVDARLLALTRMVDDGRDRSQPRSQE